MFPRIKALQAAHGLSDADMGRIINKTAGTYRQKINGLRPFSLGEVRTLCLFFRVSADFAFASIAKGGNAL